MVNSVTSCLYLAFATWISIEFSPHTGITMLPNCSRSNQPLCLGEGQPDILAASLIQQFEPRKRHHWGCCLQRNQVMPLRGHANTSVTFDCREDGYRQQFCVHVYLQILYRENPFSLLCYLHRHSQRGAEAIWTFLKTAQEDRGEQRKPWECLHQDHCLQFLLGSLEMLWAYGEPTQVPILCREAQYIFWRPSNQPSLIFLKEMATAPETWSGLSWRATSRSLE